jgi:hypothetical protein
MKTKALIKTVGYLDVRKYWHYGVNPAFFGKQKITPGSVISVEGQDDFGVVLWHGSRWISTNRRRKTFRAAINLLIAQTVKK